MKALISPVRGIKAHKSLDLDDVFGAQYFGGKDLSKKRSVADGARSVCVRPGDVSEGEETDTGQSVATTGPRSSKSRGHRNKGRVSSRRRVLDPKMHKSVDNFGASAGLINLLAGKHLDNDDGADEDEEELLAPPPRNAPKTDHNAEKEEKESGERSKVFESRDSNRSDRQRKVSRHRSEQPKLRFGEKIASNGGTSHRSSSRNGKEKKSSSRGEHHRSNSNAGEQISALRSGDEECNHDSRNAPKRSHSDDGHERHSSKKAPHRSKSESMSRHGKEQDHKHGDRQVSKREQIHLGHKNRKRGEDPERGRLQRTRSSHSSGGKDKRSSSRARGPSKERKRDPSKDRIRSHSKDARRKAPERTRSSRHGPSSHDHLHEGRECDSRHGSSSHRHHETHHRSEGDNRELKKRSDKERRPVKKVLSNQGLPKKPKEDPPHSPKRRENSGSTASHSPISQPVRQKKDSDNCSSSPKRPGLGVRAPSLKSLTSEQEENKPEVLRQPSLRELSTGEDSPRSGYPENASRDGTTDDDTGTETEDQSDDGTVLQFDPSQDSNVFRVKQVANDDPSIMEIVDPVGDAQQFQAIEQKRKESPIFDFLGQDDEDDELGFVNPCDDHHVQMTPLDCPSGGEDADRQQEMDGLRSPSGGKEDKQQEVDGLRCPSGGEEVEQQETDGLRYPSGGEEAEQVEYKSEGFSDNDWAQEQQESGNDESESDEDCDPNSAFAGVPKYGADPFASKFLSSRKAKDGNRDDDEDSWMPTNAFSIESGALPARRPSGDGGEARKKVKRKIKKKKSVVEKGLENDDGNEDICAKEERPRRSKTKKGKKKLPTNNGEVAGGIDDCGASVNYDTDFSLDNVVDTSSVVHSVLGGVGLLEPILPAKVVNPLYESFHIDRDDAADISEMHDEDPSDISGFDNDPLAMGFNNDGFNDGQREEELDFDDFAQRGVMHAVFDGEDDTVGDEEGKNEEEKEEEDEDDDDDVDDDDEEEEADDDENDHHLKPPAAGDAPFTFSAPDPTTTSNKKNKGLGTSIGKYFSRSRRNSPNRDNDDVSVGSRLGGRLFRRKEQHQLLGDDGSCDSGMPLR